MTFESSSVCYISCRLLDHHQTVTVFVTASKDDEPSLVSYIWRIRQGQPVTTMFSSASNSWVVVDMAHYLTGKDKHIAVSHKNENTLDMTRDNLAITNVPYTNEIKDNGDGTSTLKIHYPKKRQQHTVHIPSESAPKVNQYMWHVAKRGSQKVIQSYIPTGNGSYAKRTITDFLR